MPTRESWQPKIDSEPDFNPFSNPDGAKASPLNTPEIRDANKDTAPLQGSKDLSDDDSLEDVIADQLPAGTRPKQDRS